MAGYLFATMRHIHTRWWKLQVFYQPIQVILHLLLTKNIFKNHVRTLRNSSLKHITYYASFTHYQVCKYGIGWNWTHHWHYFPPKKPYRVLQTLMMHMNTERMICVIFSLRKWFFCYLLKGGPVGTLKMKMRSCNF